jgi:hypothetical protein
LIDKLDAAGISVPPDYAQCIVFETVQREIKFEGGGVMCVGAKVAPPS